MKNSLSKIAKNLSWVGHAVIAVLILSELNFNVLTNVGLIRYTLKWQMQCSFAIYYWWLWNYRRIMCFVVQCNFFDHRGLKIVYRRYTAFCFITGITHDEVRLTACYIYMYILEVNVSKSMHEIVWCWNPLSNVISDETRNTWPYYVTLKLGDSIMLTEIRYYYQYGLICIY